MQPTGEIRGLFIGEWYRYSVIDPDTETFSCW